MENSNEKIQLYGVIISPYVQRVRAALEYFQVPYEQIEINLQTEEQKSEQFKLINPLQQIPAITYKEQTLGESQIIIRYLQDEFGSGGKTIYPSDLDALARAKVNLWTHVFDARQTGDTRVIPLLIQKDTNGIHNLIKSIQSDLKFIAKNTGLLERQKSSPEGTKQYYWGKQLSLADFVYLPNLNLIYYLLKFGAKINLFESIEEADKEYLEAFENWYNYTIQNDSFQRVIFKLPYLPPADKSPLVKEAGWTSVDQYSYEDCIKTFLTKLLKIELPV